MEQKETKIQWIIPGKIFNYMEIIKSNEGETLYVNLCYVTKIEYLDGKGNVKEIINKEYCDDDESDHL